MMTGKEGINNLWTIPIISIILTELFFEEMLAYRNHNLSPDHCLFLFPHLAFDVPLIMDGFELGETGHPFLLSYVLRHYFFLLHVLSFIISFVISSLQFEIIDGCHFVISPSILILQLDFIQPNFSNTLYSDQNQLRKYLLIPFWIL